MNKLDGYNQCLNMHNCNESNIPYIKFPASAVVTESDRDISPSDI